MSKPMQYSPQDLWDRGDTWEMDADTTGHYLVVCADYHTHVRHQAELGNLGVLDSCDECYAIGNMEGRLLNNACLESDFETLAEWEQEVEAYKEEHGGTLFPDIMEATKD